MRFLLITGFVSATIAAFFVGRLTHICPEDVQAEREVELIRLVDPAGKNVDWGYPTPKQPTISQVLEKRGITPDKVTYIKFVGDESSYTTGREVTFRDRDEIEWLWTWIFDHAEPYSFWVPSGYRRLHIFTSSATSPAAILFVNETDATHVEGISGRFMCHGLEQYITQRLKGKE